MKNILKNIQLNNQQRLRLLILLSFFYICTTSCSVFYSKNNYIKDFSNFIQDAKTKSPNYTLTDWANADLQFEKLSVEQYEKYKPELSENDKETIGKLKGSYNILKFKKEAKDALEQTKDLIYQAKGVLEEVKETTKN